MASDSGQSSQTSVGGSGQQPETSSALNLLKTRDWLKSQLHDYRSDTTTGAESSPGTSDILQLSRRLKSLQDELFFKTLDLDKKEQLTKRIQLGHALEGYLFPEGGEDEEVSAEMKERRLHLEQLVNKQADLVSRISKIHEEMTEARPGLEALKKENFGGEEGGEEREGKKEERKKVGKGKKGRRKGKRGRLECGEKRKRRRAGTKEWKGEKRRGEPQGRGERKNKRRKRGGMNGRKEGREGGKGEEEGEEKRETERRGKKGEKKKGIEGGRRERARKGEQGGEEEGGMREEKGG
ncbi:hypothetical protein ScPMuIL_018526 [Solemya velum]